MPTGTPGLDRNLCVFQKKGRQWSIVFAGEQATANHSLGMFYIAYLLEHRKLHVRDLCSLASPRSGGPQADPRAAMSNEELADQDLYTDNERSPTDRQDDAELLATYRSSRDDLASGVEQARRGGDFHKASILQERLDALKRAISAEFGPAGGTKQKGNPNKKACDSVSKAIKAAYREIEGNHQTFSQHLKNAIHYGTYIYTYTPDSPLNWTT